MKASIFYLGDSIVAWNPNQRYQKYGIPGHTTLDMYWTLSKHPEIQGDVVIFSLGVNDIVYGYSAEKSFEHYESLFRILEERFSTLVILSLLPTDSVKENQEVQNYNAFLKQKSPFFCDLFSLFLDEKRERIALQYTTDGTHLSRMGYELLNQHLDSFMEPFFSLHDSSN